MPRSRLRRRSRRQPYRLVIFGVQGSGKGTQAELLARRFGLAHIATGEIFRRAVAQKTAVGRQVQRALASGQLVADRLTNAIIRPSLMTPTVRRRGFALDGYPRNRRQLDALQRIAPLTHAIQIALPDRVAVARIAGRLNCVCGLSYHVKYHPPKYDGRCDRCGRALFVRADDQPATVRKRLAIYHRQTAPLINAYRRRGLLITVDGRPAIREIHRAIVARLKPSAGTSR